MRAVLATHRHLALLVAVLMAQLFLLAYQIKARQGEEQVRLIRVWAMAILGPVEEGLHRVVDGGSYLFHNYVALTDVRQENERLRAELDQARLRVRELETRAAESDQLAALLEYKQLSPWVNYLKPARVIGSNPASITRVVSIDRGRADGLRRDMPVLTPEGLVGKVVEVFEGYSQVVLITDPKSGVGVQVVGSDLLGVVKGSGGVLCRLEYIPNDETIAEGAELVTSGQDQLFPKGLPVGRVTLVSPGESFLEIRVQPAAPLSRLEHVLVLAGPPESLATTAQAAPAPARPPR